ncbi:MAG: AraC family transcriptional regulator [Myxococcaceae bacterium]
MGAEPTISARAIMKLADLEPDFGVSAAEAYAESGIDPAACADADARVPLRKLHLLWDAVLRRLPRSDLALVVAQRYAPGDYGLVGFVCMNSPTLGESLHHVTRYVRLWTDEPVYELADDGCLSLTWRTRFPEGQGLHMTIEAGFAEVLNGARLVTQQPELAPHEVRFRHQGPKDTSAHQAFFGTKVVFGAAADELRFSKEQLALALPKADPQLRDYLRTLANDAMAKRGGGDSVQDKLRALLAEELQKGLPPLGPLAKRLGLSERTLRRRLEESGTTFRELLDQTRGELAQGYIRDRRIPLSEVAFLLGFSEPSTFHRAFRRWTDMTPAAWRQRHAPPI